MSIALTAAGIAEKYNMWIRFQGTWYTPDRFGYKVNEDEIRHIRRSVTIMNPVEALKKGRWMIIEMVRRRDDPLKIEKAILKMAEFEEDIRSLYKHRGLYPVEMIEAPKKIEEYYQGGIA